MIRALRFAVDHYLVVPLGVAIGLVWANTWSESYFRMSQAGSFAINNIGMAFVLAYLMQEAVEAMLPGGTLHPWRRAMLPIVAAAGGLIGSAVVYQVYVISLADEPVLAVGWPIVCAVDIALSFLVAKSIFRHNPAAVTFVLMLTIATDAAGLWLISRRYPSRDVYPLALTFVIAAIAGAIWLRRAHVRSFWPYLLIAGTVSWWACFWGGVHPALALLPIVPFLQHSARKLDPVADHAHGRHQSGGHFEYVFRYPVQVVMFLFGLLNGGVLVRGFGAGTWAVLTAAVVGRPLGILIAVGLAVLAGLQLPHRLGWRDMVVIAMAASSGFTFALFFSTAVFPVGPTLIQVEMGALATVAGALLAAAAARLLHVGRFATSEAR